VSLDLRWESVPGRTVSFQARIPGAARGGTGAAPRALGTTPHRPGIRSLDRTWYPRHRDGQDSGSRGEVARLPSSFRSSIRRQLASSDQDSLPTSSISGPRRGFLSRTTNHPPTTINHAGRRMNPKKPSGVRSDAPITIVAQASADGNIRLRRAPRPVASSTAAKAAFQANQSFRRWLASSGASERPCATRYPDLRQERSPGAPC
jgi:hypothetical protein